MLPKQHQRNGEVTDSKALCIIWLHKKHIRLLNTCWEGSSVFQTQSSFPSKGKAECCMLQASCTWGVDFLDSIRNFSMTISPPQPPSVEEICCGSSICNLKTQEQMMATGVMFHIATSLLLIVITNMISHTHPRHTHSLPCPAPKKKEKKSLKIPEVLYARWPSSAHRLPDSTDKSKAHSSHLAALLTLADSPSSAGMWRKQAALRASWRANTHLRHEG